MRSETPADLNTMAGSEKLSPAAANTLNGGVGAVRQPAVDSRFRLIVVAALRTKQLLHGARPRIEADPRKRRNTSIALEEVRQGLVPFTISDEGREGNGGRAPSGS